MSYSELIFSSSIASVLAEFRLPLGEQVKPVGNQIFILGDNAGSPEFGTVSTSGAGDTVTVQTLDDVYLNSPTALDASLIIGNLKTTVNYATNRYSLIENLLSNQDIIIRPAGLGYIQFDIPNYTLPFTAFPAPQRVRTSFPYIELFWSGTSGSKGGIFMGVGSDNLNSVAHFLRLTSGDNNITIQNAPGSVTISADGTSGTQAGAYNWQLNTFTGTEQRSFSIDRNDGLMANSSIVGPPTDPAYDFDSTSPIEYTIDSVADWALGDSFHVMSRNKGNFNINMPEDVSIFHTGFKMNKSSPKDFLTTTLVKKSSSTGQSAYITAGNPVYPAVPVDGIPIAHYFNGAVGTYVGELPFAVSLNAGEPPTIGTREKAFVIIASIGSVRATNATPQTTNFINYR